MDTLPVVLHCSIFKADFERTIQSVHFFLVGTRNSFALQHKIIKWAFLALSQTGPILRRFMKIIHSQINFLTKSFIPFLSTG